MRAGSGRLGVSAPPAPSDPARRWLTAPVIGLLRRHGDVLKNASSLLATTGVTSAMGFAYWTVAARLMSQRAVGFGSATVSAVTLLATIGMFGLGAVLIGELPRRTRRGDRGRRQAATGTKAQQEAGLAVLLLSLATTIGPDRPIPGDPARPPAAGTDQVVAA